MFRLLLILGATTAAVAAGAGEVFAQQRWPAVPLPAEWRGSGDYLSWIKIIACWLMFMMWVRSADWISRDAQEVRMHHLTWNPIVFGCFVAALLLLWIVPVFWLGFTLLVVAYVGPLAAYLVQRHRTVAPAQRDVALNNLCMLLSQILVDILHMAGLVGALVAISYLLGASDTAGILAFVACPFVFVFAVLPQTHHRACEWLSERCAAIAGAEKADPHESGPPVVLKPLGGPTPRDENVRLLSARQCPGFLTARVVIADGLSHRAHAIMLDYTQQAAAVHWMIDGVWHPQEPLTREEGDPLLEALKVLAGLNPQDRKSQQKASFTTEYEKSGYATAITCQGTKTGERVLIQFQEKAVAFENFDEIGIRSKMQEEIREALAKDAGFVLLSAMPGNGLRSTTHLVVRNTDRYTREFVAIEDEANRYQEIENCPVVTYKAAAGETPATILPKIIRTMPEVMVVRDLVNAETVNMLCREVRDKRLIIGTVRAKDTVDALMRVLAMGVPAAEIADGISVVLGQRLIRKLCDTCKEAYAPTPQVLAQLGIPEGRVQAFHRPPQEPEEVCKDCDGMGYKHRTAIFELLKVGDAVRKVLRKGPTAELLRQAARKDGLRSFQEEGILLVAKGTTSLPELMRVLKQ